MNFRLGPRELSVDQWITDTLPPNSNSNTSNASASLLSQQQQQQSHQSKIMNVVVPNVACPPAATKKIRRKPENKVSLEVCFLLILSPVFMSSMRHNFSFSRISFLLIDLS
jgi:hypothetical protein